MQFALIARDATDEHALERRLAHRPAHLEKVKQALASGDEILGAAMIGDDGTMCGSIMIFDVEDRAALDRILEDEPFITENVWGEVEIIPIRLAPPFEHLLTRKG